MPESMLFILKADRFPSPVHTVCWNVTLTIFCTPIHLKYLNLRVLFQMFKYTDMLYTSIPFNNLNNQNIQVVW